MPKDGTRAHRRHNPLHEEILENTPGTLRKVSRSKRKERASKPDEYVDAELSKKILQIAREQQDELVDEAAALGGGFMGSVRWEEHSEDEDSGGDYEDEGFGEDEIIEELVSGGGEGGGVLFFFFCDCADISSAAGDR